MDLLMLFQVVVFLLLLLAIFNLWWFMLWAPKNTISLRKDTQLLITKEGRWELTNAKITPLWQVEIHKHKYPTLPGAAVLNKYGKALHAFPEGKPTPLHISYNKVEWWGVDALQEMINNESVKNLLAKKDAAWKFILMVGAVCAIAGLLFTLLIFAKAFGIIKSAAGGG